MSGLSGPQSSLLCSIGHSGLKGSRRTPRRWGGLLRGRPRSGGWGRPSSVWREIRISCHTGGRNWSVVLIGGLLLTSRGQGEVTGSGGIVEGGGLGVWPHLASVPLPETGPHLPAIINSGLSLREEVQPPRWGLVVGGNGHSDKILLRFWKLGVFTSVQELPSSCKIWVVW